MKRLAAGIQVCEASSLRPSQKPTHFIKKMLVSATTMQGMFAGASAFDQPLSFDTAEVTDVSVYSFVSGQAAQVYSLSQTVRIERTHLTKIPPHQMSRMFQEAAAFNQPLPTFDTTKVTNVRVYSLSQTVRI